MNCPICKARLREGSNVCPGCGRVITAADRTRLSELPPNDDTFGDIDDVFGETPAADDVKRFRPRPRSTAPGAGYTRPSGDPTRPMGSIPVNNRREPERFSYDPDVQTDIYMRTYYGMESPLPQEDVYEQRPYKPQPMQRPPAQPQKPAGGDSTEYVVVKPKMSSGAKVGIVVGIVLVVAIVIGVSVVFGKRGKTEPEPVSAEQTAVTLIRETTTADNRPKPGYYRVISEDPAPVYNAHTGGTVTSSVKKDTVLLITQIRGDRGKTEEFRNSYGQLYSGWINLSDLEASGSEEEYTGEGTLEEAVANDPTGEFTVVVSDENDGKLNVRSGPGTENNVLGTLDDGDVVIVDDVQDGWAHVSEGPVTGWVSANYLEKNS